MAIITVEDESPSQQANLSQEIPLGQGSPQDQQGTQPQALLRFLSKNFVVTRIFSQLVFSRFESIL